MGSKVFVKDTRHEMQSPSRRNNHDWGIYQSHNSISRMTLPIDPGQLEAEDIGEKRATLAMDHEQAIEFVRGCCEEVGFGIPVEFSPSELLNEKVDADRDPYYVLGACNPAVADRALDVSEKCIGGLFPCNVIIWETESGRQDVYHVSIMRIARLVGMAPDDDEWDAIVAHTGDLSEELYDLIEAEAV